MMGVGLVMGGGDGSGGDVYGDGKGWVNGNEYGCGYLDGNGGDGEENGYGEWDCEYEEDGSGNG